MPKGKFNPGSYNQAPSQFREVSARNFSHNDLLGIYRTEERNLIYDEKGNQLRERVKCLLFWKNDGEGYAIQCDFKTETVRFYEFGCKHNWKIDSGTRGTQQYYRCTKCRQRVLVDSSD